MAPGLRLKLRVGLRQYFFLAKQQYESRNTHNAGVPTDARAASDPCLCALVVPIQS